MLGSLFPITDEWSSYTFLLYLGVSMLTVFLCKAGADNRTTGYGFNSRSRRGRSLKIRLDKMCYFFAYVLLVLLATLRSYNVGPDTSVYVGYFLRDSSFIFDFRQLLTFNQMEPGFQLYLLLIQKITNDYHVFFLITYGMIAFSYIQYIQRYFDRNSDYILLEIFIFYYVSNMSGMRSAMGMIFLLPSFIALDEKKYIKATILTLLASCFHYTMGINLLIVFLVWVLSGYFFRKKRWVLPVSIAGVAVAAYLGLNYIYGMVSTTKYGYYHVSYENLSLISSLVNIPLAILVFLNYRSIINLYEKKSRNVGSLYVVVSYLILYPIIYLTGSYRIPNYYGMPRINTWSSLSEILKERLGSRGLFFAKLGLQVFVILFLLFKFTRMSASGSFAYVF